MIAAFCSVVLAVVIVGVPVVLGFISLATLVADSATRVEVPRRRWRR